MLGQQCCDVPPHLFNLPTQFYHKYCVTSSSWPNTMAKKFDPPPHPPESMGWQGIPENTLRTTTNCGHTSLTDDTSAGLKCSATVRVCSTLAASRRLFLAGSDFSSVSACWYVSFPSAIYSKKNNKRNLHLKLKTWWYVLATKPKTTIWQIPLEQ